MSVCSRSWSPYAIQVCMAGREWLRRGLLARTVESVHQGNKPSHVDDYGQGPRLLEQQRDIRWSRVLDGLLASPSPPSARHWAPI